MKRRAFTLVEIVSAVVLLSIVSVAIYMLFKSPLDVNIYSEKEFNVQSDIRLSSETINTKVKNATAAFLLTKKDKIFTNGWNYFITDEDDDFSRIVLYEWNGKSHVKKILSEFPKDNVVFDIGFQRNKEGNLLQYEINAEDIKRNRDYNISSEVKVLNASNIIDESRTDYSLSPPKKRANCLAFRSDRPDPTVSNSGYNHISISFVLDVSGSMKEKIGGGSNEIRMAVLKDSLKKFIADIEAQDKAGIVDVRLYPFAEYMGSGNQKFEYLKPDKLKYILDDSSEDVEYKRYFNIKKRSLSFFDTMVDSLKPFNTTNVSDGLRFAYHGISEYEKRIIATKGSKKRIKHYLFVLTDGIPNEYTWSYLREKSSSGTMLAGVPESEVYKPHFHEDVFDNGTKRKRYFIKSTATNKDYYTIRSYDVQNYNWTNKYIELTSGEIKKYRTKFLKEPVDVTVVGFSGNPNDLKRCNMIGQMLGAPLEDGKYYKHCNSSGALQGVFKSFTESVIASTLWYISGPQ